MATRPQQQKFTPPQIAQNWGISEEKILGWIKTGELHAINAATAPNGRPRYLIDATDLEAFQTQRAVVPVRESATAIDDEAQRNNLPGTSKSIG